MKKTPSKSPNNDPIIPIPDSIGLMNPIFSSPTSILNNNDDEDLTGSPPSAPLSDLQTPRRRDSRNPSFSTSASSMSCSPYESPFRSSFPSSSSIPFSWERQPGIPKSPEISAAGNGGKAAKFLPPPPPSHYRRKRSDGGDEDPFFAALSRCARDGSPASENDMDANGFRQFAGKTVGIWRRAMIADRIGLMGLNGCCKSMACSVSDAMIVVPRSSRREAGSYGRMNRRPE